MDAIKVIVTGATGRIHRKNDYESEEACSGTKQGRDSPGKGKTQQYHSEALHKPEASIHCSCTEHTYYYENNFPLWF